jgi:hypothetical protein
MFSTFAERMSFLTSTIAAMSIFTSDWSLAAAT